MLLLHGLFGSLGNLGVISHALNQKYQCYHIDLPNHGLSPHFTDMDYIFQANQIKKFIDSKKLQNISLIGHSMGGKVAMMFSLLYPKLVEKLVVLDISPVAYQTDRHQHVLAGLIEVQENMVTSKVQADVLLTKHIEERFIRQFLLSSLYKNNDGNMQWRFNLSSIVLKYHDILNWPAHSALAFLGDTLFIKGQNSEYILPEHRAAITDQFPKASASIIANTGHWLHSEKPKSVIRFIQHFLAK